MFGSAFEPAFAFQKAQSQTNTLVSQSCFSSSTKLKAAPPLFLAAVEVGNFEKITHPPPKKINDFWTSSQPTAHNSFSTAYSS